ncbi:MAG: hypothetical protein WCD49_05245 [Candidatus Acidiferrales bacterium]
MVAIGVAVVLLFVGVGGAATDTAGKFSGRSLKGAAESAAVATGDELPVFFTGSESFWAFAGGAAEGAAEVCDCEPPLFSMGSARSACGAGFAAGVALALGDELRVSFTGSESFWASARGAAEGAAKVFDGEPSFVF